MIAALQTYNHIVIGYSSFDTDINLASFTRYQIEKLSRFRDSSVACDVLLKEKDRGLERISTPRHEAMIRASSDVRPARPAVLTITSGIVLDGADRRRDPRGPRCG